MPIIADCHLHSSFSGDSDTPMEDMVLEGTARGLETLCFTEHNDFDYPPYPDLTADYFILDTGAYLRTLNTLKEKYTGQINLLWGVELGLQPGCAKKNAALAKAFPFDFIIGSSHVCHGKDPWYPGFFEDRRQEEALGEYFESILENLRCFQDFDVYGHLDYILRYAPRKDEDYSYEKYAELLEEILKTLIQAGKGLELNTGGIKSGLRDFHPSRAILRRYRQLGGEIITVGSDSHGTAGIGAHFASAAEALRECGFRYYSVFENRTPRFLPL